MMKNTPTRLNLNSRFSIHFVADLSALGLMDRIGWIRGKWRSRKDNLLLANLLGQTHVFYIDPNYPDSVGMFVGHRVIS